MENFQINTNSEIDLSLIILNLVCAFIGIASKDRSSVYLDDIIIDNVFIGLAAYIKKIEYGSPKIKGSNINLTNFKHDYISDLKSLIVINDQRINNIDCKEKIEVCNF